MGEKPDLFRVTDLEGLPPPSGYTLTLENSCLEFSVALSRQADQGEHPRLPLWAYSGLS